MERLKIWRVMGIDYCGESGVDGAEVADGGSNLTVGGKGAKERSGGMDARFLRVRVFRGRRGRVLSEAFLGTVCGHD